MAHEMKLSQILSQLLVEYSDRPLPLSVLLERSGTNGFGTIAGILTIPMLIPLPIPLAGFSALVGSGIILVGCQLALGYSKPYLPDRLARLAWIIHEGLQKEESKKPETE
jgi:hypothetical protein